MNHAQEKIISLLRQLVAVPSLTDSSAERPMAAFIEEVLGRMDYFQKNPSLYGQLPIAGDYLGRTVTYGLVKGKGARTVILMNHYDVVPVEEFGSAMGQAFDMDALPEKLAELPLDADSRADLESGEWLFGRGVGDMKGGGALQLVLLEEFSQREEPVGNLLFLSVPDEESYSAGMRGALPMLEQLKREHGLDYRLLIDSEPVPQVQREGVQSQVISVGSVGKMLPVVVAQGEKAHVSQCFRGLNPLGILTEIYRLTDLSVEFCESYKGEVTVPPTWTFFKDRKESYDVSLPLRAAGYFNVLTFTHTPEEVLRRLTELSRQAFETYVARADAAFAAYQQLGGGNGRGQNGHIDYPVTVLTFRELCGRLRERDGEAFVQRFAQLQKQAGEKLHSKEWNYPQATIHLMEQVLDLADLHTPLVLLGFAPPYYPAYHSQRLAGREEEAQAYSRFIREWSQRELGLPMVEEQYCQGISDCSYCGLNTPFDTDSYAGNTPLWGESLYSIDFEALEQLGVPAFLLGPWGKDPHKYTERVNIRSLTQEMPRLLAALTDQVLAGE